MKNLVLILSFCFPFITISQTSCVVEGAKYNISGTKMHCDRTKSWPEESFIDITQDSIIYYQISWETKDTLSQNAESYRRVSFSKKDAKKNKSTQVEKFPKVCQVTIEFKKNVLIHVSHLRGEKTSYRNKEKTSFQPLFDSKEKADHFINSYFK